MGPGKQFVESVQPMLEKQAADAKRRDQQRIERVAANLPTPDALVAKQGAERLDVQIMQNEFFHKVEV